MKKTSQITRYIVTLRALSYKKATFLTSFDAADGVKKPSKVIYDATTYRFSVVITLF
jgi:hypothetical protein